MVTVYKLLIVQVKSETGSAISILKHYDNRR
jgi:hypothetical protein